MRASISRALEARRAQREENGDAGFSLIELIIVVVILGILAAIAIPIFLGLQGQAKQSSLESIVGNGAAQAASDFAQGEDIDAVNANLATLAGQAGDDLGTVTLEATGSDVDDYCVTGSADGLEDATAGPGCAGTADEGDETTP